MSSILELPQKMIDEGYKAADDFQKNVTMTLIVGAITVTGLYLLRSKGLTGAK